MTDIMNMTEIIDLTNVKYLLSLSTDDLKQYIEPLNKYGEKRTKEDLAYYLSGIKTYLNKLNDEEKTHRDVSYVLKGCNRLTSRL